jgi:hypothetical protein
MELRHSNVVGRSMRTKNALHGGVSSLNNLCVEDNYYEQRVMPPGKWRGQITSQFCIEAIVKRKGSGLKKVCCTAF